MSFNSVTFTSTLGADPLKVGKYGDHLSLTYFRKAILAEYRYIRVGSTRYKVDTYLSKRHAHILGQYQLRERYCHICGCDAKSISTT